MPYINDTTFIGDSGADGWNGTDANELFRGNRGTRSDVKQAVVTLAEGQKIDVTTGL